MQAQYLHIPQLLTAEELDMIQGILAETQFVDGKLTASMTAQSVKNNLQVDIHNQHTLPIIQNMVGNALMRSKPFHEASFAIQVYPFLFSKYEQNMTYGWHVDSPIMGERPIRTDLAMTIFLSPPDSYEGGELVIESSVGQKMYKPQAGDAVMYPCMSLHCVMPVTQGTRLAAVTWIQSMIRNPEQREILFQMKRTHASLYEKDPLSAEANQLLQVYSNLMRMWVEI